MSRHWIRLPRHKMAKSWSDIEDPVVPRERNVYGHPLAGLLWERQFEEVLLELGWETVPNWEWLFVHRKQRFLSGAPAETLGKLAKDVHKLKRESQDTFHTLAEAWVMLAPFDKSRGAKELRRTATETVFPNGWSHREPRDRSRTCTHRCFSWLRSGMSHKSGITEAQYFYSFPKRAKLRGLQAKKKDMSYRYTWMTAKCLERSRIWLPCGKS